jgi:hypothetical protein
MMTDIYGSRNYMPSLQDSTIGNALPEAEATGYTIVPLQGTDHPPRQG